MPFQISNLYCSTYYLSSIVAILLAKPEKNLGEKIDMIIKMRAMKIIFLLKEIFFVFKKTIGRREIGRAMKAALFQVN